MTITEADVRVAVIDALKKIMKILELDEELSGSTVPIGIGMKSRDQILCIAVVSERMNCEIPDDAMPFVTNDNKPRNVDEIVSFFHNYLASKKGNEDA